MKEQTFKRYEYIETTSSGETYFAGYTIKEDVAPLGFKGEKLVETFTTNVKE